MQQKQNGIFLNFVIGLVGGHCIGVDPYYLAYKAKNWTCSSNHTFQEGRLIILCQSFMPL